MNLDSVRDLATFAGRLVVLAGCQSRTKLGHVQSRLKSARHECLGAEDEVDVFVPLWRTMLALVIDALAKALSLPMVMLWDSLKVVLSSLLHKSVGVRWQEYFFSAQDGVLWKLKFPIALWCSFVSSW